MGHHHAHHGHHHGHHHGAVKNIKVAFFVNLAFTLLELFGGLFTNSVAILSDALHDLGDSFSLGLAWYLERKAAKRSDKSYSYGYARFSVAGAFVNSIILIVGAIFILQNTIPRLIDPESSDAEGMIVFAVIGIAVNGFAALRLQRGSTLNERAVSLHLLEDVLGWVAILVGSLVMLFADVPILDPILSLAIMAYVLFNVFRNLGLSFRIFLQGTPAEFDLKAISTKLEALEGVQEIHDFHLWTLDGQYHVATLHAVMSGQPDMAEMEQRKSAIREMLKSEGVQHVTIELEDENSECGMEDCADSGEMPMHGDQAHNHNHGHDHAHEHGHHHH